MNRALCRKSAALITKGVEKTKCIIENHTRQHAPTAERNVTFHLNQTAAGQCIAANVTQNEDRREDIKLTI